MSFSKIYQPRVFWDFLSIIFKIVLMLYVKKLIQQYFVGEFILSIYTRMGDWGQPILNLKPLTLLFHLYIVELGAIVNNEHTLKFKSSSM